MNRESWKTASPRSAIGNGENWQFTVNRDKQVALTRIINSLAKYYMQQADWNKMNALETTTTASTSRIGVNCILLGRGGATNNHEGNKRYRTIVSFHQAEYLAAKKKDKTQISKKIVAIVKANGGRFLKQDSQHQWVEVSDKKAIEKTSQALREGLDVRNHTVRPRKLARRHLPPTDAAPKVVVDGWVVLDKSSPPSAAPKRPVEYQQSSKKSELKEGETAQLKSSIVSLDGGAEQR